MPQPTPPKNTDGRDGCLFMLGLGAVIIGAIWFLAQQPRQPEARARNVQTSPAPAPARGVDWDRLSADLITDYQGNIARVLVASNTSFAVETRLTAWPLIVEQAHAVCYYVFNKTGRGVKTTVRVVRNGRQHAMARWSITSGQCQAELLEDRPAW